MFPKKGTYLPVGQKGSNRPIDYPGTIAAALRAELGGSHQAIKTIMRWTGANERTAKNWLGGQKGPRGEHLLGLLRHSDAVLEAVLQMAGREGVLAGKGLVEARDALAQTIAVIDAHLPRKTPR